MKIISKIPDDKVMVVMTTDELANILGYYSKFDSSFHEAVNSAIKHETSFNVSEIYDKHRLIHSVAQLKDYDTARRKLQDMLSALTPVESLIQKLNDI